MSDKFYCINCSHLAATRYKPFNLDTDNDENVEADETLLKVNQIHENCNSFSANEFNRTYCNQTNDFSSILFQNIDGNKSNFDSLALELKRYNHKFSIIAIAETNTSPEQSSLYQLTGYNSFYQNTIPNKSKGTGVALYICDTLSATVDGSLSTTTENLEALVVSISGSEAQVTVGVVYRPPSGDMDSALSELSDLLDELPGCSHLVGDFNIDLHDKNNNVVARYEDILFSKGFFPLVSLATHIKPGCKPSCIDNIVSNDVDSIIATGTLKDHITHHSPIFQIFNRKLESTRNNLKFKQYYDYCQSNIDKFLNILENDLANNIIGNFTEFHEIYKKGIDKTCKLERPKCSKRTVQNNPWITPGLIVSINHQHKLYKDWVKARKVKCKLGEVCDKGGLCHCPTCSKKHTKYHEYTDYRRILKKTRKNIKTKYYTGKFLETKGNSKKTWELINRIRGKKKRQIKPLFTIDNEKVTNRRIIANEFNKYFVSLAANLNEAYNEIGELSMNRLPSFYDYLPRSSSSSIYLHDCDPDEVSKVITELKNGKSSDIPIHIVKQSSNIISPLLSVLYNECMRDGVFPDDLKTGRISPIYKKDNEELLENYRTVSTLAVFGKIFEKIIYRRLYNFFQSQNTLYENQYGFRKNHSTNHALNFSVNYVESCLKKKQHVLGIFIDLSKAFDTVPHQELLSKLENYGIRGNANNLISSYLSDRFQYVSVLGEDSEKLPVVYGVPQGSCLGPLLFIIYINDISRTTELGKFVLFADDTNIFVADNCKKRVYEKANRILHLVHLYMKCNLLHINIKKCCYIHFEPSRPNAESNSSEGEDENVLALNSTVIKRVNEAKFLGVIIDEKLKWTAHVKALNAKLKCETGKLCRIRNIVPKDHYKELYHTLFESHLGYGISVWGGISNNKLEPLFVTQKKYVRIMFGDKEAYLNKMCTSARARTRANQKLSQDFYEKEHTKPLFNLNNLLTVHNLYKYTCLCEMFKIIKLAYPNSLLSLFHRSPRRPDYFITPSPSSSFIYKSSHMWNSCRKPANGTSFSSSTNFVKNKLKKSLLDLQSCHRTEEWSDLNFDINELSL
ncbi:hypothetical protein ACHWQZ_G009312 [Mnemiopsis leidyi]